jgi:hypothetical protein
LAVPKITNKKITTVRKLGILLSSGEKKKNRNPSCCTSCFSLPQNCTLSSLNYTGLRAGKQKMKNDGTCSHPAAKGISENFILIV